MHSFTVTTREQIDMDVVLEELAEGVEVYDLKDSASRCFGILMVDANLEISEFFGRLQSRLRFPVAGFTAVSLISEIRDDSASAVLTVVCDADYALQLTAPLTLSNCEQEMETAYFKARSSLVADPKVVFLFAPLYPDVMMDDMIRGIPVSREIPIFGGIASDNQLDGTMNMLYKGELCPEQSILVLLGGHIEPVFEVVNAQTMYSEKKGLITQSESGFINRVGGRTFKDFMEYCGLRTDENYQTGQIMTTYATNPVKIIMNGEDDDGVPVVHNIFDLDREKGSIFMAARVPEGAEVSICHLKRDNIVTSTQDCIERLADKIKANEAHGARYSMILAVSCGGRYFVITGNNNIEREILNSRLPERMSIAGFYASGEICPTSVAQSAAVNRSHHSSLVLCAF
ncbi:MAG: FIST C-terminal domain-containing protein [Clostridiales bacterium]|jgi:hypothetical protein|nr:FIST C-terminal domain-containing protein [Clostridiales bacterium]